MNTNTNNNAQAQELAAAVTALTQVIEEAIKLAKEEEAVTSTTTEATATTAETTTAAETTTTTEATPVIVLDDDDSVIGVGFKGSMIEQDPMDPMPSAKTAEAAEATQEITDETATAEENADKYLDNILCDISALYDIAEYTLGNEGCNVSTDNSPYAPGENKFGYIDNYKAYISKEIIKEETITGEFRLIVSEKNSGVKILDHSLKIINDHIKVFSSENTVRIDKIKESKKLMRFLEITDEVSALVMSKYISD